MRIEIRHLFAAPIAVVLAAATTAAADDCSGILYPRRILVPKYSSPYACTEPAPPSRFPPVPISNPFACDSPYCDQGYGGNPYAQGAIPLPPPPGSGPYGSPPSGNYGTFPYGTNPYGTNPYGASPYGTNPYGGSPFGSPPGNGPLTPGSGPPGRNPPIFQHSRTISGVTREIEEPLPSVKVSFWNQTGSEVTLFVGDRTHRVLRDRAIVLSLPREFTWKTDVVFDRREQVPGDLNYFDVVIR
jgi:hypothetical protein